MTGEAAFQSTKNNPYRAIVEATDDIIFQLDLTGKYVMMNSAGAKPFQMSPNEILGRSISDFFPPEFVAYQQQVIQAVIASKESLRIEAPMQLGSEIRTLMVILSPVFNDNGDVDSIVGVARDITAMKSTEKKLRESEAKWRSLAKYAPNVIFNTDINGVVQFINVEISDPNLNPVGKNIEEFVKPDRASDLRNHIDTILQTGKPISIETIDQHGTWYLVRIGPSKVDDKITGLTFILTDITGQKKLVQELEESEQKFAKVFQTGPDSISLTNLNDGTFIEVNEHFLSMIGYTRDEVVGKTSFDLHIWEKPEERNRVIELLKNDGVVRDFEMGIRRKDGSIITALLSISSMEYRGNECLLIIARDITERKKTEDELLVSVEKFEMIFQTSPDVIAISRISDGLHMAVNDAFCKETEYTREEVIGKPVNQIGTWRNIEDRKRLVEIIKANGYVDNFEGEFKSKSGKLIHGLVSVRPIVLNGDPCFLMIVHNISERKSLEIMLDTILRETVSVTGMKYFQSFAQSIAKTLRVRMVTIDRFPHDNRNQLESIGRCQDVELIENRLYDLADSPCSTILTRETKYISDKVQELYPNCRELQELGITSYLGIPLISSTGELLGILAIFDNKPILQFEHLLSILSLFATRAGAELERLTADVALKDSEQRYRDLSNLLPQIVFEIDVLGSFTYSNIRGFKELGFDESKDVTTINITDVVAEESQEKAYEDMRQVLNGHSLQGVEYTIRRTDRSTFPALIYSSPIYSEGKVVGVRGLAVDISDRKQEEEARKRLEAMLRQSQKLEAIGQLAGGVAHDFNNLLSPILGYSEMLMNNIHENDPRHNDVREIYNAADRASGLTRQLLAFSRKQVLELKPVALDQIISDFQKILRRTIREDISITFSLPAKPIPIVADIGQIEQILMNLAINAQDAMTHGGELSFKVSSVELTPDYCKNYPDVKPGRYAQLTVSDTGSGISTENLSKIFEPFFTTKEQGKGTGLGLSTVFGIVKQHSGHISVESKLGKGTTFRLYFIKSNEAIITEKKSAISDGYKRGTEKLLVVEDNDNVREMTCQMLEFLGYKVYGMNSPAKCVEFIHSSEEVVDLMLSDVIMPEMNGKKLFETIRQIKPDMKVLFMSGYTSDVIAHQGILEEGIHFIQKPFSIESISRKLREVLD